MKVLCIAAAERTRDKSEIVSAKSPLNISDAAKFDVYIIQQRCIVLLVSLTFYF